MKLKHNPDNTDSWNGGMRHDVVTQVSRRVHTFSDQTHTFFFFYIKPEFTVCLIQSHYFVMFEGWSFFISYDLH